MMEYCDRDKGPDPRTTRPTWEIMVVAAATFIGFFLRMYHLGKASLLSLEAYTWDFSNQTFPIIFGRLAHIETNPPFYYAFMKLVMRLGDTEFILRLPSAVAGTLAIPLLYLLGRFGGAPLSGAIGAALLALSALNITYSRQARVFPLVEDFCLLAAIGLVVVVGAYVGRASGKPRSRQEAAGWAMFTLASIVGFYLHYSFLVEIFVLECAVFIWWLTKTRFNVWFLLKWFLSSIILVLGLTWGLVLARNQAYSENINWIQVPSVREAAELVVRVNGYMDLYRFQPWASLLLTATACVGLITGWRRSPAILVSGLLFALFPLTLFVISQFRPVFIERVLVPPSFAVCLLAGSGCLFLLQKLMQYGRAFARSEFPSPVESILVRRILVAAAVALMLLPAAVSARNSLRESPALEPYDKVAKYIATVVGPGDVAAGTDGVIYYRRKINGEFPYFKIVYGNTAEAQMTYGSAEVHVDEITRLAPVQSSIYLVLRENLQSSSSIRSLLGHTEPPVASFGALGVYRVKGSCPASAPCVGARREETRAATDPP